jgi:ABC-type amino acid transport substrate-binding protein
VLTQEFLGADLVYGMKPIFPEGEAVVPEGVTASEREAIDARGVLDTIRARGAVRVCVMTDRVPYSFLTPTGDLVGLDVEMAHRLAADLTVRLEFLPVTIEQGPALLARGTCDLAMSGISVTPERARGVRFSEPYLDETLGFVVRDDLRDEFSSWARIRELGAMRVSAPNLPYYIAEVRRRAPALQIDAIDLREIGQHRSFDVLIMPAERGSVMTLLNPRYTAVVPEPDPIRVPLAYPVARQDERWTAFLNTWIELKRRDGTIDALYRHWVLGKDAVPHQPRWSIVRDRLHWVK